ncbi:hypothetical protein B0H15DRAFT_796600 [Mycena belliarum]|uniref:Uncharacterized protein n=1 Tax=Mycena belliarum TaxID=1033014 RepID=A0AAD6UJC5_9AGAR|nr:hypothetical protein B0H15DRAFT_796600 [Mycena belliae]
MSATSDYMSVPSDDCLSSTEDSATAIDSGSASDDSATTVADLDELLAYSLNLAKSNPDLTEPPSPNGSTKGLYVRSRPTSFDGAAIDFPCPTPDSALGIYGLAAAFPLPPVPAFPPPPVLARPPPGKKRRYAASVRSLSDALGTGPDAGTGTSLKTNRAPLVPVQLVRRAATELDGAAPQEGAAKDKKPRGWSLKGLKKIVPGIFPRPAANAPRTPLVALTPAIPAPPAVDADSPAPRMRGRALSIRSFRSGKGTKKKRVNADADAENCPPVPPPSPRGRTQSFSGFLSAAADDDEDETDAQMIATTEEVMRTVLRLNEEYRFELYVPSPSAIGVAF